MDQNIQKKRNVEKVKILGYFAADYIIKKLMPESLRTVYVPEIIGQKIIFEDKSKDILNREIYVNYEARHLLYSPTNITPEQYASFLGRDIAMFVLVGLSNVPRHIRPNYYEDSFKTCMIDLDNYDPRTFRWNCMDLYSPNSLNYENICENEVVFVNSIYDYFIATQVQIYKKNPEKHRNELRSLYLDRFIKEIKRVKGNNVSRKFKNFVIY